MHSLNICWLRAEHWLYLGFYCEVAPPKQKIPHCIRLWWGDKKNLLSATRLEMCIFPCWRGCLYRDGHGYLMRLKCFSYHCQWFFNLKWRKQTTIPFDEVTGWCYGKALCCQVVIRFSNSCGFLALEAVAPGSLRGMIHSISGGEEDAGCCSLLTLQVSADKSIQNCSADNPPWASLNCGVKITSRKGRWAQSRPNTGSLALTTCIRNCQNGCNERIFKGCGRNSSNCSLGWADICSIHLTHH